MPRYSSNTRAVHFIDTEISIIQGPFFLFTIFSTPRTRLTTWLNFYVFPWGTFFFLSLSLFYGEWNVYLILPPSEYVAIKTTNKILFQIIFFYREPPVLGRYDNKDVLLKLPLGVKVRDLRWLSVWCRRFAVNIVDLRLRLHHLHFEIL